MHSCASRDTEKTSARAQLCTDGHYGAAPHAQLCTKGQPEPSAHAQPYTDGHHGDVIACTAVHPGTPRTVTRCTAVHAQTPRDVSRCTAVHRRISCGNHPMYSCTCKDAVHELYMDRHHGTSPDAQPYTDRHPRNVSRCTAVHRRASCGSHPMHSCTCRDATHGHSMHSRTRMDTTGRQPMHSRTLTDILETSRHAQLCMDGHDEASAHVARMHRKT